jgi:DNA polymerase I-like protein with 3'-5' exonuclease and polymerase domains
VIEFDTETTGLQWYAHGEEVFLAQFLGPSTEGRADLRPLPAEHEAVQGWLNQDLPFRAWNTKFDLHWLADAGFDLPPEDRWHDGMVMAHVADERTSVALKARGERLFGSAERDTEAAVKDWLKQERAARRKASKDEGVEFVPPNYGDVPDSIMHPYAAQDVLLQARICEVYERLFDNTPELAAVYELERQVMAALYWVEHRGIPIDRAAAVKLEAQLVKAHDDLEERAKQLAGIDTFNPRSPAQISEALLRSDADTSFATASANGIKTDEENLSAIDHPLAQAVLEYRATAKMYAMVRAILHGKGDDKTPHPYLTSNDTIHPNFRQIGARTGRMSCSDPNIQQWHRDDLRMRYLVKARPGHKLVAADLDAIEMRVFAAFTGDGILRDAIKRGRDIHTMAAEAAGIGDRTRTGGAVETARQRGKTLNYAIIYGAGVRSLRKAFGVNTQGAKAILRRYHAQFPEVGALQNRIEFALADKGYVASPWGRRFRATEGKAYSEAYKFTNYLVQGTAADLMKASLVRVHEAGIPVIAVVHDEIVAEVPEEDAPEAAKIIEEAFTDHEQLTEHVPLSAEAQIVDRWSDAKEEGYVPPYITQ